MAIFLGIIASVLAGLWSIGCIVVAISVLKDQHSWADLAMVICLLLYVPFILLILANFWWRIAQNV